MMWEDVIFYIGMISLIISFIFFLVPIVKTTVTSEYGIDGVVGTLSTSKAFRWKLHDHNVMAKETAHPTDSVVNTETLLATNDLVSSTGAGISGVDLWGDDSTTYFDQGAWGSCTAFAMKYALALYAKANPTYPNSVSGAFLYAQSRLVLNLPLTKDSGSTNAATARVITTLGIKGEDDYPYFSKNIFLNPSSTLGASLGNPGYKVTFVNFRFVSNENQNIFNLKAILNTKPIICAILLYPSSMTDAVMVSGLIPMPSAKDLKYGAVGGHAVCITGYDSSNFLFRNSWGTEVGNVGSFSLPYAYLSQFKAGRMSYVSDAWYY